MKKLKSVYRNGAFALPVAIALSGSVFADPVQIDPDGSDPTQDTITVDALDWSQSSTLAVDAVPVEEGNVFKALTMARLGNFQLLNVNIPNTGLNVDYEWTVVIAFFEEVLGTSDTNNDGFNDVATFRALSGEPSLLEIYHDPAQNADQLAGTGFNDGNGPILTAELSNNPTGVFIVDVDSLPGGANGPEDLDQFGSNDWPDTETLTGTGSTGVLDFSVTSWDEDYFPGLFDPINGEIVISVEILFGNVSQQLPFQQVDPALQVWDPLEGDFNPSDVGEINLLAGPDNLFQTDKNSSFDVQTIPEPSTVALLGVGLTLIAFGRRRRRT